jgi:hypothetical protein
MHEERERRRDLPGDNRGDREMEGKLSGAAPAPTPDWQGPTPPEEGSRRAADNARPGPVKGGSETPGGTR